MTPDTEYTHISLADLAPSPTNPRKHFDEDSLRELAATIADHGVIEPIIVRPWPADYATPQGHIQRPEYEIVAGERRYRASLMTEQATIPALVRDLSDRQVAEIQVIENLQRRGINELEEADGYRLMMDDFGYSADELAGKIGKSRAYIYGRLKLCDLGPDGRAAFDKGDISASVALLIARIPVKTLQKEALHKVVGMSARQAAEVIQGRYMLSLSRAPFPLDAALIGITPCTTCPKNSSSDRDQYADIATDVCTDPDCFEDKRAAHVRAQAESLRAAGHTVIEGEEAIRLAPYGANYPIDGLVSLDSRTWTGSDYVMYREMLADTLDGVPRTFVEIDSRFIECITREAFHPLYEKWREQDQAQAAAQRSAGTPATPAAPSANALRSAEAERKTAYRQAMFDATRARYRSGIRAEGWLADFTHELRAIAHSMAEDAYDEHLALAIPDADSEEAICAALDAMDAPQLLAVLLDLTLAQVVAVPHWQGDELPDDHPQLLAVARAWSAVPAAEAPETPSTPAQAAPAPALDAPETPSPAPEAAQAPDPKPAKAKAKPKATPAPAKATAKSSQSSSRASPAGGKGKTTRAKKGEEAQP